MTYSTFIKYNNRSRYFLGKRNLIYIDEIKILKKKNMDDLCELRRVTDSYDDGDTLPNKVYSCSASYVSDCWWGSPDVLLSNLIARVIAYDCWIVNPEVLENKDILGKIELLPPHTPISVEFNEEERMLNIKVYDINVGSFCLPELLEDNAETNIFGKTIKNLRTYGLITVRIENKLLGEIERVLNSEEFEPYKKISLGVL